MSVTVTSATDNRAAQRCCPGDLIVGRKKHSAIATLVERSTRYLMLVHLPDGYNSAAVRDALIAAVSLGRGSGPLLVVAYAG